jgi:hypothetical protein
MSKAIFIIIIKYVDHGIVIGATYFDHLRKERLKFHFQSLFSVVNVFERYGW